MIMACLEVVESYVLTLTFVPLRGNQIVAFGDSKTPIKVKKLF
jgi:hypothetical protein